jgi:hypothetical protein
MGHTGSPAETDATSAWLSTDGDGVAGSVATTGARTTSRFGAVQFIDEAARYPTATRLVATLMNVPIPGPRAANVGRDGVARSDSMRALNRA